VQTCALPILGYGVVNVVAGLARERPAITQILGCNLDTLRAIALDLDAAVVVQGSVDLRGLHPKAERLQTFGPAGAVIDQAAMDIRLDDGQPARFPRGTFADDLDPAGVTKIATYPLVGWLRAFPAFNNHAMRTPGCNEGVEFIGNYNIPAPDPGGTPQGQIAGNLRVPETDALDAV